MEGDDDSSKTPKAGRRAGARRVAIQDPPVTAVMEGGDDGSSRQPDDSGRGAEASMTGEEGEPSPRPQTNKDAFSSDSKFSGVSRRKAEQRAKDAEDRQGSSRNSKYQDEEVETLMEIPELEEEGNEDLTAVVAEAPKLRVHKVQDISELDDTAMFHLPANDDQELDFSLLTSCLCSAEQVFEADEIWELEQLFADVACELNLEREKIENALKEADSAGGRSSATYERDMSIRVSDN